MGKNLLLAALICLVPLTARKSQDFKAKLSKDEQIHHALSRLTFGERPDDFEAVKKLGLKKWIDRQLHSEKIAENPALEEKLKALVSLTMTNDQLVERYPPPQVVRAMAKRAGNEPSQQAPMEAQPVRALYRELAEGKLYRAVYSNRQLAEVLTDFWFNHFNVHLDKGFDRFLTTGYERDAIRPNVLGKFGDLLKATAQSPAMLFYLDNWQSVTPEAARANRGNGRFRGLNENYARELMELHTLGVDGGYTQQDVIEVARCFTGWTIAEPLRAPRFQFNPRTHDKGEKVVLGVKIPAGGGMEDGLKVLDILAHHRSTARFVSQKLAQRFVADQPPPELVARMAATFQKSDGDLRAVMKTMLDSKEFWSEGAYRSKVKSPLEMVVGAVRASNADVRNAAPLANQIAQLGQPLYRKQEPTGYSNSSEEWLNSASLLGRMNFATALANGKIQGVKIDSAEDVEILAKRIGGPEFQKR